MSIDWETKRWNWYFGVNWQVVAIGIVRDYGTISFHFGPIELIWEPRH